MEIVRTWEEKEHGTAHTFVHVELMHEGRTYMQQYNIEALKYGGLPTVKKNAIKRALAEVTSAKKRIRNKA